MPGIWDERLQQASLGGVEVPVKSRRIKGGRDGARKRLPYVGGQEVEDTGRLPRALSVTIELFADVDPDHYPARYEELVAFLQDDEGQAEGEWIDPVWGPMDVKVWTWEVDENAEARDGATIELEIEELGIEESANLTLTVLGANDRATVEDDADDFDDLIDELAITGGDVETAWAEDGVAKKTGETTSFLDGVQSFTKALDAGVTRADKVAAQVQTQQARIQSVMNITKGRTSRGWRMRNKGHQLIATVTNIGEAATAREGRIITRTLTGSLSIYDIARDVYGDVTRADEVLQRNPVLRPLFMPSGTVLRIRES